MLLVVAGLFLFFKYSEYNENLLVEESEKTLFDNDWIFRPAAWIWYNVKLWSQGEH